MNVLKYVCTTQEKLVPRNQAKAILQLEIATCCATHTTSSRRYTTCVAIRCLAIVEQAGLQKHTVHVGYYTSKDARDFGPNVFK